MYAMRSTKTFSEFNEIIEIDRSSRSGIFSSRERLSTQLKLKRRLFYLLNSLGLLPLGLLKATFSRYTSKLFPSELSSKLIMAREELYRHPNFTELDIFSQALYEIFHVTILPTLLRNYDRYSMASVWNQDAVYGLAFLTQPLCLSHQKLVVLIQKNSERCLSIFA